MTDGGIKSWTGGLSPRERIREIATTLTQPRSVDWIQDEAQISSRQTAKAKLALLVEFGHVHAIEGSNGDTQYAPNYQRRYVIELLDLINDYTRPELREEIAEIDEAINEWKTEYDVESREDLGSTLTDNSLTSVDVRERNTVRHQWRLYEDNKQLLKHALALYDDAREYSPGVNESSNPSD